MKESALVRRIRINVKAKYPSAYVIKLADRFTRFLPDLLIVYRRSLSKSYVAGNTSTLFVETKVPKTGRLSEGQKSEHRKILLAGGELLIVTSAKKVLDWLEQQGAIP